MYAAYRKWIDHNLEPVLRVPGVTLVGINTSHGVTRRTLTWNVRDISIIGDIRKKQIELARAARAGARRAPGGAPGGRAHHRHAPQPREG